MWNFTQHAKQKMVERNINEDEVKFVLFFASKNYKNGKDIYTLEERNLPAKSGTAFDYTMKHFLGTTVVTEGLDVITTYRKKRKNRKYEN